MHRESFHSLQPLSQQLLSLTRQMRTRAGHTSKLRSPRVTEALHVISSETALDSGKSRWVLEKRMVLANQPVKDAPGILGENFRCMGREKGMRSHVQNLVNCLLRLHFKGAVSNVSRSGTSTTFQNHTLQIC